MAAIEGLDLTENAGAIDVSAGAVNGEHVDALAGVTGASTGAVELIVVEGGAVQAVSIAPADQTAAQTVVGSALDSGAGALSAPEYTHRGGNAPVSADE